MALHRNLTGDDLHEPKGLDLVDVVGKVYTSDGIGSGTWEYPPGTHGACRKIYQNTSNTQVDSQVVTNVTVGWSNVYATGDMTYTANSIVLPYVGYYEVDATVSMSNIAATFQVDFAVDGVLQGFRTSINTVAGSTPASIRSVALKGVVAAVAENADLTLTLYKDSATNVNVIVWDATLTAKSLP
jgi:hypothetical protein